MRETASEDLSGWSKVIVPKAGLFDLSLRELWDYRSLLWQLVVRDLTATYKQTVLGPDVVRHSAAAHDRGFQLSLRQDGPLHDRRAAAFRLLSGWTRAVELLRGLRDPHFLHLHEKRPGFRQGLLPATHRSDSPQ
jgi:hypothetical protein